MPLSQALLKLIEAGLLTALTPRPLSQLVPPKFMMDLRCAYYQGPGHETDRFTTLRHAIQYLIDKADGMHSIDFAELDDHIHMLNWDELELEPIVSDEIYEIGWYESSPRAPARPLEGTSSHEEVRREDDEILSQIRVETTTMPKGLIHMATTGRATCIVLRIPTSFNLVLGGPWIHRVGVIPSSLQQKISHSDDDLFFTGFTFNEVQTLEMKDFYRDFITMSFDQHDSIVVLDMMRNMSYLLGMGLG
ncbi:hypothetical protein CK203_027841 [Vitis vinifera]|uniref:Uncharacterized protein n=1 Tax=Vitis vinifera TaxID=29760 RepID=A0A438J3R5_VITVI|nr:hypothetical protein CK203_027841 [Vitis vinifera]